MRDGKVEVDGGAVKASRELKEGEVIRIRSGAHYELHEVLGFPKSRVGAKLVGNYIADKTPDEERQRQAVTREMMREMPKGLGRPTKKDRRDWDKMNR